MNKENIYLKKYKILLAFFIFVFIGLTYVVMTNKFNYVEKVIYEIIIGTLNPFITKFMIFITNIGSTLGVLIIVICFLLWKPTRKIYGIPISLNLILSVLLNNILKIMIKRPRPEILWLINETGYGFPSGHSMNNAALYMMISIISLRVIRNRELKLSIAILSFFIVFSIGASRVYLGVHNVGDVLAGWSAGIAIAIFVDMIFLKKTKL